LGFGYNRGMKYNDYTIYFGAFPTVNFEMRWVEGGREYRLCKHVSDNQWMVQKNGHDVYQTMERYDTLEEAFINISSYTGPCEEETMELYGLIRQTLAATDLEEVEVD
jgi:hypothetical protein